MIIIIPETVNNFDAIGIKYIRHNTKNMSKNKRCFSDQE